jgi:hypothetical protein
MRRASIAFIVVKAWKDPSNLQARADFVSVAAEERREKREEREKRERERLNL